jgi:hypothetical protein
MTKQHYFLIAMPYRQQLLWTKASIICVYVITQCLKVEAAIRRRYGTERVATHSVSRWRKAQIPGMWGYPKSPFNRAEGNCSPCKQPK